MIYNLRDIGGWSTADGKKVKRGLVFRSGALCYADERDEKLIKELGIVHVFDLRSIDQSDASRDRVFPNVNYHLLPPLAGAPTPGLGMIRTIRLNECADPVAHMLTGYASMTTVMERAFSAALKVLAYVDEPALFHCQVGKDRTGGLAAVLLTLLGVERTQVIEDYMLTNLLLADKNKEDIGVMSAGLSPNQMALVKDVFEAKAEYISAYLDAVERECGSVSAYASERLRLTKADISALRARLTE